MIFFFRMLGGVFNTLSMIFLVPSYNCSLTLNENSDPKMLAESEGRRQFWIKDNALNKQKWNKIPSPILPKVNKNKWWGILGTWDRKADSLLYPWTTKTRPRKRKTMASRVCLIQEHVPQFPQECEWGQGKADCSPRWAQPGAAKYRKCPWSGSHKAPTSPRSR